MKVIWAACHLIRASFSLFPAQQYHCLLLFMSSLIYSFRASLSLSLCSALFRSMFRSSFSLMFILLLLHIFISSTTYDRGYFYWIHLRLKP
ncbi:hypothetical protein Hdeb2414_s0016g00496081 [Helianthus debilis subsp. tardiflorus]